jgi:hypothetical protein
MKMNEENQVCKDCLHYINNHSYNGELVCILNDNKLVERDTVACKKFEWGG